MNKQSWWSCKALVAAGGGKVHSDGASLARRPCFAARTDWRVVALCVWLLPALWPLLLADSLWNEHTSVSIVGDKRAAAAGDILNIVVQESNSASKDNNTQTSKKNSIDAKIATFLYGAGAGNFLTRNGQMPALKMDSQMDFNGGGKINNSEKIIARIAVQVVDVLPNGNLVIEGRRQTSFSGESQDILLRGTVRPADIAANNTVFSYNVADVNLKFISKGTVTDAQRKGWFIRIWEKVSPF
jgi:flagellar L-ring protein FlgH